MELFWFIPTHGDGRYLGTPLGGRPATFDYFAQVARAADHLGFAGALLPTGRGCEDAWVTAAALLSETRRLRFLVAVRPGLMSPTLACRMAATFDRLSGGRLLVNVVTGGDRDELRGDGLHLDHDERYALTDEFLTVWRALARGESVDYAGEHLRVEGGKLLFAAAQPAGVPLYFGGSSPAAMAVAARHADVYLTWGEPPADVAAKIARVRELAGGRALSYGIRLHVIVRETEAEAWAAADRLIAHVTDDVRRAAHAALGRYDSEGQQRMLALHAGGGLRLGPNLWAGVGLVRGGAGTALVGDADGIARLMGEYAAAGIATFILSGYPHLEEAYHVAELLFPRLALARPGGPAQVGEVVANGACPTAGVAR